MFSNDSMCLKPTNFPEMSPSFIFRLLHVSESVC